MFKNAVEKLIALIDQEELRQETTINLVASENYPSAAIRRAMQSMLGTKYAEGYPKNRYYAGCSIIDEIEEEGIAIAKKLFEVDHANLQPHSGSNANIAVLQAILKPGQTILSMSLDAGGHLSHGHPLTMTGKTFNIVHYGVNKETGLLDYNEIETLAKTNNPALIIAGASSYPRDIDYQKIAAIAQTHKAYFLADIAHNAGPIAAKLLNSPAPYADFITGTTQKTLRGPRGGFIFCKSEYKKIINQAIMPGIQGGPHMNMIAAKALCFAQALEPEFVLYQKNVIAHAKILAKTLSEYQYQLCTNGTDTHIVLIDLQKTHPHLTGKQVEEELALNGIITNRNVIPGDTRPARFASGLRLGTAAMTTRGWIGEDFNACGKAIHEIIKKIS